MCITPNAIGGNEIADYQPVGLNKMNMNRLKRLLHQFNPKGWNQDVLMKILQFHWRFPSSRNVPYAY
jgi:hypothetical protein